MKIIEKLKLFYFFWLIGLLLSDGVVFYGHGNDFSKESIISLTDQRQNDNSIELPGSVSEPNFSHSAGFYENDFYLKVFHPNPDVTIRYTLNGSEPNQNSPVLNDSLFIFNRTTEPDIISAIPTTGLNESDWHRWEPPAGEVFKVTNLRVRAFDSGMGSSRVITKTFIVAEDLFTRYTIPVISISIEEHHLFGQTGIFTNYSQRGINWEKPMHIEFFEPDGEIGFATDAGVRVHGGNSRRYALKSLRLYFRGVYGDKNIDHPVFPDQQMNVHDRLILRNSGSDWAYSYFRDAFVQNILNDLTTVEYQAYRPAIIFLNGEYWGVMNIRERFDNNYFENHYGDTEIDFLENTGQIVYGTNADYFSLIDFMQNNDLNEKVKYEHVKSKIDVDNFRDYHILQVFSMNTDQPGKNASFWKPQTQDGLWRWMWWDMDDSFAFGPHNSAERNGLVFCTGLNSISSTTVNPITPPPSWAPNSPEATFPLRAMLQNELFREEFIIRFADFLNSAFKPEYLNYVIDSFRFQIDPYMHDHFLRWHRPEPEIYEEQIGLMHDFANDRSDYMRNHLVSFFELDGEYSLNIEVLGGEGFVRVNSIDIAANTPGIENPVYPWNGVYFRGTPVKLEAVPAPGYVFSRWEIPEEIYSRSIILEPDNDLYVKAWFEIYNEEQEYKDYNIYPNPSNLVLNINSEVTINSVRLLSLTGVVIRVYEVNNFFYSFDLTELYSGNYFIQIIRDDKTITDQIIIAK